MTDPFGAGMTRERGAGKGGGSGGRVHGWGAMIAGATQGVADLMRGSA